MLYFRFQPSYRLQIGNMQFPNYQYRKLGILVLPKPLSPSFPMWLGANGSLTICLSWSSGTSSLAKG